MNPGAVADIEQLLRNAGYYAHRCQMDLCLTDPTCIWPPLLEFINTAWIVLTVITAFLLAGWGIAMVRGAMYSASDVAKNLRNLLLIFGTLSAAIPIVNVLGADKYVVSQCKVIRISQAQVQELLNLRDVTFAPPMQQQVSVQNISNEPDEPEFNF